MLDPLDHPDHPVQFVPEVVDRTDDQGDADQGRTSIVKEKNPIGKVQRPGRKENWRPKPRHEAGGKNHFVSALLEALLDTRQPIVRQKLVEKPSLSELAAEVKS